MFDIAAGTTTTLQGVISNGASPGSLVKTDTGTLLISGTNTYTGATDVNGGTLRAGSAGAFGSSSTFAVAGGATLDLNGFNETFGACCGAGTVSGANATISGTFAPGNGTPGSSMTVTGNLAFQSGAHLPGAAQSGDVVVCQRHRHGDAGRRHRRCDLSPAAAMSRKQYTILTAAGGVSGTFGSLVNTNLPTNFTTSLSYDATACLSQSDAELRRRPDRASERPQRQPAERRQCADQFLQLDRQHSAGVRRADAGRPDAGLRRDRDRLAADHLRCDEPVHGRADRSLHRRSRRWRRRRGGATPYADEDSASAYAAQSSTPKRARRLRDLSQGAAGRPLRSALERVGGGLWRLADHRRQRGAGIEQRDQQHLRHRGRRRLSLLAVHDRRLCAGRRRHQFQRRQWRQRPLRPVPGRRLRAPHRRPGLHLRRRWPMAGRTSPPTAP